MAVRALLAAGAAVDLVGDGTNGSATPLWEAAYRGHVEVVRLLIAAGANPHEEHPRDGTSPLEIAMQRRLEDVVAALEGTPGNPPTRGGHVAAVRKLGADALE